MLAEKNRDIKKAYDLLQIISKDEKARMLYEAREAERRDQITWMKSSEDKGEAKGMVKLICQYLEDRFGAESQALQEMVKTITDLNALGRISKKIFFVTQLDEATALIQGNVV